MKYIPKIKAYLYLIGNVLKMKIHKYKYLNIEYLNCCKYINDTIILFYFKIIK